jgi:hypothetical protein
MTASESVEPFESLGRNCEFGFVQRNLGYEPGGLLRWAVSRPGPLVALIRSEAEGLYRFENLTPFARDMVHDTLSGICFHSRMYSQDGVFLADEAERRAIWQTESEKIDYLKGKLLEQIQSGSKIFVYKNEPLLTDEDAENIASALRAKGPAQLLCVRDTDDLMPGEVRHHASNLWFGRIDRFAPRKQADDVSMEVWQALLMNALSLMRS